MRIGDTTRLFLRFRERGDLGALAAVFDRTAPHLVRIAGTWTRDPGEVEDLLQATFLTALEDARTFDAERRVEPWLAGILVNRARAGRRRRASELALGPDAPSPGTAADPGREAEAAELEHALAGALERLPATYRDVLRPHLLEGKTGGEIARELGRPAGTVRMQLHRALARLRGLLPAGFAAATAAVLLPPSARASVRATVLRHAARRTGGALAGAGSSGLTVGGLLVSAKLLLLVPLTLIGAAGLWLATREPSTEPSAVPVDVAAREPAPDPALAAPLAESTAAARDAAVRTDEARRPAAAPGPVRDAYTAALSGLTGRVVEADGTPVPDLGVELIEVRPFRFLATLPGVEPADEPPAVRSAARTDAGGRFRLDGARLHGVHALAIDAGGPRGDLVFLSEGLLSGEVRDVGDVVLEPVALVTGVVVDEHGAPIAGARVRVLGLEQGAVSMAFGDLLSVRADSSLLLEERDGGDVVALPTWLRDVLERLPMPTAQTDGNGRYTLPAPIGTPFFAAADDAGRRHAISEPQVLPAAGGGPRELPALVLERDPILVGRVESAEGAPAAGVEVLVGAGRAQFDVRVLQPAGTTDAEGRFAIGGLAAEGEPLVAVRVGDEPWRAVAELRRESSGEWIARLAPRAALELVLADDRGRAVDGAFAFVAPAGPTTSDWELGFLAQRVPLALEARGGGRYRAPPLAAGEHRLWLGGAGVPTVVRDVAIAPGAPPLEVAFPAGRGLEVRVVDAASGAPVERAYATVVEATRQGSALAAAGTDAQGRASIGPLREEHEEPRALHVDHPAYAPYTVALPGDGSHEVRLSRGAELVGQVVLPAGASLEGCLVGLRPEGVEWSIAGRVALHARADAEGRFRFTRLAPGTYRWEVAEDFVDQLVPMLLTGDVEDAYDLDKGHLEAQFARGTVELREGERRELEIAVDADDLPARGTVRGLVTIHGRPAPGAAVLVQADRRRHRCTTDADGRFELAAVEAGEEVDVMALAGPMDTLQTTAVLEARADLERGDVAWFELALEPVEIPVLVVSAATGEPVPGATVTLETEGRDLSNCRADADGEGRIAFTSQLPARCAFRVSKEGWIGASGEIDARGGAVPETRVELEPATPCAGRVVLAGFRSVEHAMLCVAPATAGEPEIADTAQLAGETSDFELTRLGPGRYLAWARVGRSSTDLVEFDLTPSGVRDLELRLTARGE